jgi:hypothetical protein
LPYPPVRLEHRIRFELVVGKGADLFPAVEEDQFVVDFDPPAMEVFAEVGQGVSADAGPEFVGCAALEGSGRGGPNVRQAPATEVRNETT